MSKLYYIQENIPICMECGGGMKLNRVSRIFQCYSCGNRYKIIDHSDNERELICEKIEEKRD